MTTTTGVAATEPGASSATTEPGASSAATEPGASAARAGLVSEATAYRYFPDLVSLLLESDVGVWPDPAEALAPVAASDDPVERVGFAAEVLFTGILARQSAVRAMIAASITRPDVA